MARTKSITDAGTGRGADQQALNREGWLTEMAAQLEPCFRGFDLGDYRVTCGWPSSNGLGAKTKTVGQCFGPESSAGKTFELFISPLLAEPVEVGGTLAHEMAHVAAGIKAAHGKRFVAVCRHVGLTRGKPRQVSPGDALEERIRRLAEGLGPYPHAAIQPKLKCREKKITSVRLECPECGCKFSLAVKYLAEPGLPTCGCGTPMRLADPEEGE